MRFLRLLYGDTRFQFKYGFYFLYAFFMFLYMFILYILPENIKEVASSIIILTDPAAMGLFFMGAIVLLEKSQRVNCSLAVSPIKVYEYLWAKVLSLSVIATIVGIVLSLFSGSSNIILTIIGIIFSSILFSLFGLFISMKIDSLNKFMIATVPFEIAIFVPAILYILNIIKSPWFILHPGVAGLKLIHGSSDWVSCVFVLLVWTLISFLICNKAVKKSFAKMGGAKL